MDLPTKTYIYQYTASALVLIAGLWLGHKGGTAGRRWIIIFVVGFVAYALAHAFFQFIAPLT